MLIYLKKSLIVKLFDIIIFSNGRFSPLIIFISPYTGKNDYNECLGNLGKFLITSFSNLEISSFLSLPHLSATAVASCTTVCALEGQKWLKFVQQNTSGECDAYGWEFDEMVYKDGDVAIGDNCDPGSKAGTPRVNNIVNPNINCGQYSYEKNTYLNIDIL